MKRKLTRIMAILLTLALAFSLTACGGTTPAAEETPASVPASNPAPVESSTAPVEEKGESTIYMNIADDPQGFDVWAGSASFMFKQLIFETLFVYDYDNNYRPNPNLIESYELAEDRMGMFITINKDVYSQNGVKLVPQDLIWSVEMMLTTSAARFAKVFDVEKSYVVDEDTVYLASAGKWVDFNYDSTAQIYICSQEAYEMAEDHFYHTGACGTGPYMVESYTEGNEVVLVKNPDYDRRGNDYWGAQNIDRIVCKVISEASQKTIEFETDGIDFIVQPGTNDLDYLESLESADVYQEPLNKNIALKFNCSEGNPLNDQLVRQAIAYAIDNEAICNQALQGRKIAATGVTNPVCVTWDDSMYDNEYYSIDTEKAKQLLADAGYADGLALEICYSTSDGEDQRLIAQIIQNQLEQAGITVSIVPYDNAAFDSVTSSTEGWDIALTLYKIQDNAMFHFWNLCNTNKKDSAFWGNEEFQALLDEALYSQDKDLIDQMVTMYETELPYYVIAYQTTYFVVRDGIENVRFKGNNWYYPGDWDYTNAEFVYD